MEFSIAHDHPSLPGHFPGRPIVPGVVLLERVIEAIERQHGALGPLRLPQVKFVQPLLPGELATIMLEACPPIRSGAGSEQSRRGEAPRWRFRVLRGNAVLASGEVVAPLFVSAASRLRSGQASTGSALAPDPIGGQA